MTTCFEAAIEIASGHPAIDRYLAESYEQVRGMSSRFAAAICGHLIRRQSELAIAGDLVEIGTFEGRVSFTSKQTGATSSHGNPSICGSRKGSTYWATSIQQRRATFVHRKRPSVIRRNWSIR
jgi:hypothetical protein